MIIVLICLATPYEGIAREDWDFIIKFSRKDVYTPLYATYKKCNAVYVQGKIKNVED